MSAKAPTPMPEGMTRSKAPSAPPPVRFEPWRTIEVPPSIRDHCAFDELCERLAAVGVRVVI
jgi:hypothetical protein